VAEHLDLMAAEFHAQALRAELKARLDSDLSGDPFDETDIEKLRLLLDSSEIADMFDETARQRIGEFISQAASRGELGVPASGKQPDR
jgi:hypothetical protein